VFPSPSCYPGFLTMSHSSHLTLQLSPISPCLIFVKDALFGCSWCPTTQNRTHSQWLQHDWEYMLAKFRLVSFLKPSMGIGRRWDNVAHSAARNPSSKANARATSGSWSHDLWWRLSSPLRSSIHRKQTCNYHYTYRTQGNVSILSSMNSIWHLI